IAGSSIVGPRVMPGVYTVRMTKGKDVFETTMTVKLDRRDTFGGADRQAQFDAATRVKTLFGTMSDLVARINAVRTATAVEAAGLPATDASRKQLTSLGDQANAIRQKIVATTEGGAITGEERLREHADELYGAIMSWEGRPTDYQLAYLDTLTRELADVQKAFTTFQDGPLATTNAELKSHQLKEIVVPANIPEQAGDSGGGKEGLEALLRGLDRD
ncbi:MAG: hypothetical protein ABI386_09405, partial [Rhodanobacter sp.]